MPTPAGCALPEGSRLAELAYGELGQPNYYNLVLPCPADVAQPLAEPGTL